MTHDAADREMQSITLLTRAFRQRILQVRHEREAFRRALAEQKSWCDTTADNVHAIARSASVTNPTGAPLEDSDLLLRASADAPTSAVGKSSPRRIGECGNSASEALGETPLLPAIKQSKSESEPETEPKSWPEPKETIWRHRRKQRPPCKCVERDDPDFRGVTFVLRTMSPVVSRCQFHPPHLIEHHHRLVRLRRLRLRRRSLCRPSQTKCSSCRTLSTPLWRRHPKDVTRLWCNACGKRFQHHGLQCLRCGYVARLDGMKELPCGDSDGNTQHTYGEPESFQPPHRHFVYERPRTRSVDDSQKSSQGFAWLRYF